MNVALDWIKSNVLTVIFVVLMVAALAGLPILSGRMCKGVKEDVEDRASLDGELSKLAKTQIEIPQGAGQPPISEAVLVNDSLVQRLREVTDIRVADAQRVQQTALEHNQKDHAVLLPALFPEPDPREREVLPRQFYDLLTAAYDNLLAEVHAGPTPDLVELTEYVQRRRAQVLSSELNKGPDDVLTADEQERLTKELTSARVAYCHERAGEVGFFVPKEALNLPYFDQTQHYTVSELYDWQWQFWIYDDVLKALAAANADSDSVLRAAVKRVVWMQLWDDTAAAAGGSGSTPPGSGAGAGAGAGAGGFGRRGGGGAAGGQGAQNAEEQPLGPPVPPNPKTPVPVNFGVSLTGRASNQLFDVRNVELQLIVETAELPKVLDALARQNFISVINLGLKPIDPYQHLAIGYYYGAGPLSQVDLTVETIWFRQWTAPYMPADLRAAKGIKSQTATPPAEG